MYRNIRHLIPNPLSNSEKMGYQLQGTKERKVRYKINGDKADENINNVL